MQHNLTSDLNELQAMLAEEDGAKVSKVGREVKSSSRITCSCFSFVEIDQLSENFLREMSSGRCSVRFHHGMDLFSGRSKSSVVFD